MSATHWGATKPELATNHRNGTSGKTVLTDDGLVAIEVSRDREGTFEPQLIGKHERRFTGFDDKVIVDLAGAAQYHGDLGAGRPHLAPSDESGSCTGIGSCPDDVKCPRAWTLPEPRTHRTRPPLLGKPPRTRFIKTPTRIIV
jgi:hypothetical protein